MFSKLFGYGPMKWKLKKKNQEETSSGSYIIPWTETFAGSGWIQRFIIQRFIIVTVSLDDPMLIWTSLVVERPSWDYLYAR